MPVGDALGSVGSPSFEEAESQAQKNHDPVPHLPYKTDSELMADLFVEMDEDLSGTVSSEELVLGFVKYGISISEEDIARVIKYVDKGNQGQLTEQEWHDFMLCTDEDLTPEAGKPTRMNSGKDLVRRAKSSEFDFDTSGVSFQNPVLGLEDDAQPAAAIFEDALTTKGFDVE
jgi:hypothetical protein